MIEFLAAYEIEQSYANQAVADFAINQFVVRELKYRGLTDADIISRERIENGAEVRHEVAGRGVVYLSFCDKIIIPGDK